MARVLLRRLIGPLETSDPADHAAFDELVASLTPALLDGWYMMWRPQPVPEPVLNPLNF